MLSNVTRRLGGGCRSAIHGVPCHREAGPAAPRRYVAPAAGRRSGSPAVVLERNKNFVLKKKTKDLLVEIQNSEPVVQRLRAGTSKSNAEVS